MKSLYDELQEKGKIIVSRQRVQNAYPCAFMDTSERFDEDAQVTLFKGVSDQMAKDIDKSEARREYEKQNPIPETEYNLGYSDELEI